MKRLILLTMVCFALIVSCNTDENSETTTEKEFVAQQKNVTLEETDFITKVSAVFNKMVQNEEVFLNLKIVIEDNIIMLDNGTIRDDLIISKNTIFEDNIVLSIETIRDDLIMGKTTFEELFLETYEELFSESIGLEFALKALPKLYLGLPNVAFEDYDFWKENGFPISVEAYDNTENTLKEVSEKELYNFLGNENYKLFMSSLEEEYKTYYISLDDDLKKALATKDKKGKVIVIEKEEVSIVGFEINDEVLFNTISIQENYEFTTFNQLDRVYQTYVDIFIPDPCSGYYTFKCGSASLQIYLNQKQQLANETCETYWVCLPICCNSDIMYVMYMFEPTTLKCKKVHPYLSVISDYSLIVTP